MSMRISPQEALQNQIAGLTTAAEGLTNSKIKLCATGYYSRIGDQKTTHTGILDYLEPRVIQLVRDRPGQGDFSRLMAALKKAENAFLAIKGAQQKESELKAKRVTALIVTLEKDQEAARRRAAAPPARPHPRVHPGAHPRHSVAAPWSHSRPLPSLSSIPAAPPEKLLECASAIPMGNCMGVSRDLRCVDFSKGQENAGQERAAELSSYWKHLPNKIEAESPKLVMNEDPAGHAKLKKHLEQLFLPEEPEEAARVDGREALMQQTLPLLDKLDEQAIKVLYAAMQARIAKMPVAEDERKENAPSTHKLP